MMPSFTFVKMCCQWDSYLSTHSVRPVGSSRRWLSSVSGWHKRKHRALWKQAYLLFVGQDIMLCDPGIIVSIAAAEKTWSLLPACPLPLHVFCSFSDHHIPGPWPDASACFPSPCQKGVNHRIPLNCACPGYWIFDTKSIFCIAVVLNYLHPPQKILGICEDEEDLWWKRRCTSLSLSKINVMKVAAFFFSMLSFCLFCLPACPGQQLNDREHDKSWLSHLTTVNHLTLHLELVCTRYVKSKEPHSHAGLTAGNFSPSHLLRSLLFRSKSGSRIGLAEWVAPVENKPCVGSYPAKFMWNCPF